MKKKYLVSVLMAGEDLDEMIDELEEYVHFDYEDQIIQLPKEIVLMLSKMDNGVLGVA
jgi:hypothetical protein